MVIYLWDQSRVNFTYYYGDLSITPRSTLNFLQVPHLYEITLISTELFRSFAKDTLMNKYFYTELLYQTCMVITISLWYRSLSCFLTWQDWSLGAWILPISFSSTLHFSIILTRDSLVTSHSLWYRSCLDFTFYENDLVQELLLQAIILPKSISWTLRFCVILPRWVPCRNIILWDSSSTVLWPVWM